MKYNLTTKIRDIKKEFQNIKKYKVYSCQYRRKNEPYRKGLGKFCNSQIIIELNNINKDDTENYNLHHHKFF